MFGGEEELRANECVGGILKNGGRKAGFVLSGEVGKGKFWTIQIDRSSQ